MSTPAITPQLEVKKTLWFLELNFGSRTQFGLSYLHQLLLNPAQRLPALAITIPPDSTLHRLPDFAKWLKAIIKYLAESEHNETNRIIDVRDQIEFKYLYHSLYQELESAQIHNVFTFLKPNDFNGLGETAIIPLPSLPQKLVSLEELENEIPDFIKFLHSRPGYYPKSGELYFSQEIYQPSSVLAAK